MWKALWKMWKIEKMFEDHLDFIEQMLYLLK